jgi:dolichol-phosphate mannosyltransferase
VIVFVVPAYNEVQNIDVLFRGMAAKIDDLRRPAHVVIVDDGSRDGTGARAETYANKLSLEVVRHPVNRGVGQAFRSGFARALEVAGPGDIIVTKEADNTSDLGILPAMLARIEGGADVVLASCYAPGGGVEGTTADRLILSAIANWLLRTCFPLRRVHTFSSFYRAYRADSLRRAFAAYDHRLLELDGFVCMVEMLVKLGRLPLRIEEVPMVLKCDLRRGASKMVRSRTIAEYGRLFLREMLTRPAERRRARAAFARLAPLPAEESRR